MGKVQIAPYTYLFLALILTVLPAQWWLGTILAAGIHELGHYVTIRLLGGRVISMRVFPGTVKMEFLGLSRAGEALSALAGPLASLLLAGLLPVYPEIRICAAVQGIYNLLPVYPLDGGRILCCLIPTSICRGIEVFTLVFLWGLGIWVSVNYAAGLLGFIPAFSATLQRCMRNIPCKDRLFAVQ